MKRHQYPVCVAAVVVCLAAVCGCNENKKESAEGTGAVDGSPYLLTTAPDGGENVIALRASAKDGDTVTVVGRIGGSVNPWIENRAAFSIVDVSIPSCLETEDDGCPTPWDYCCKTDVLPSATVLIKFVDENNQLVKSGARELLKVKELQTVHVVGKAKRDEAGNLTVLAQQMFVKK